ncbi:phosphoglycolate phosphatase [Solilutibacter silvestris]|uniref:phosphoglycolate phosphatase n=1 Tax=Solilutibacter silvestris TaxID=1645665 RepID=A0A2K1Q450_9GAMM|nr:phosphoglycolate phosphatase [Lysobacter silvestris]PNS09804.1 phosphoglycolate phosphatase [Lysobacter silvestris]
MTPTFPKAVLFDLDGTLLDSAPDMLATVNAMRATRGVAAMMLDELRPHVSKGSRAMIAAAFPRFDETQRDAHVPEFLDIYARELGKHAVAFPGVDALLDVLDRADVRWGIVTNKPEGLAESALLASGWTHRSGVLVGGDSLPERKPHPLPLLHAAQMIGVDPRDCVYVGDDFRDIEAARAAGMRSVIALWGYRLPGDEPMEWGGDVLVDQAADLLDPARWP